MVSYLCKLVGVSRSGYYRYFSEEAQLNRQARNQADDEVKEIILKAYNFRRRKKGARQIKMTLENQYQITYNLKRIRRIMKKFGIVCPIRKANPYRRMAKATQEHRTLPNLLNRQFKQGIAGKVLLTDITYLSYGKGKRAYLSTIKDAETNEILAYEVSDKIIKDALEQRLNHYRQYKIETMDDLFWYLLNSLTNKVGMRATIWGYRSFRPVPFQF